MKKRYTAEQIEQVKSLYEKGETYAKISQKVGVPRGTISGIILRSGCEFRNDTGHARRASTVHEPPQKIVNLASTQGINLMLQNSAGLRISSSDNMVYMVGKGGRIAIPADELEGTIDLLMKFWDFLGKIT